LYLLGEPFPEAVASSRFSFGRRKPCWSSPKGVGCVRLQDFKERDCLYIWISESGDCKRTKIIQLTSYVQALTMGLSAQCSLDGGPSHDDVRRAAPRAAGGRGDNAGGVGPAQRGQRLHAARLRTGPAGPLLAEHL